MRLGGFDNFLKVNGLNKLSNKFKYFDDALRNRFISDFGSNLNILNRFDRQIHLLDAWKVLDNKPILRVELDFLETFADFQIGKATLSYGSHGCTHLDEAFIRHYTGPAYEGLNAATGGYGPTSPFLNEFRVGLTTALQKLPNDVVRTLHRGLGEYESRIARTWRQGQTITSEKFWSTSKLKRVAENFRIGGNGDVIVYITHRTGKDVKAISFYPTEEEALITLGKQFRVDMISPLESDGRILEIFLTEL